LVEGTEGKATLIRPLDREAWIPIADSLAYHHKRVKEAEFS